MKKREKHDEKENVASKFQGETIFACVLITCVLLQAAGLDLKENLGAGAAAAWPYPSVYHPYDAAFASYPFNG